MANTSHVIRLARPAAADLTGKLRHLVKLDNNQQFAAAGAGDAFCGVLIEEATLGHPASADISGVTKVTLGATVAASRTPLKPDANSKAVPAAATEDYSLINLEPGVAGDVVEALICFGTA